MLTVTNYENVQFIQDKEMPYLLNIVQADQYGYENKIGRFNFYTKEGYLVLLNGKRKEYSRFQSLMNVFFKYDDMFCWNYKVVEEAKKAGNEKIKGEKKAADKEYKELQINKANDFLNKVITKEENTINCLNTFKEKSDNELIEVINNTFKNAISKQLVNDILNAIKAVFTAVEEVQEVEVNGNNQTIENKESYLVGNRTFTTYEEAYNYCLESDFDPELMIIKEVAIIEPLTTSNIEPALFHLYKDTFNTYSEAYNHAILNYIPVTMIISNQHETMTNERLQQLEKEYVFSKSNMSIADINEYYNYISSLPLSADQEERYYKLKGYIQRYEYKQQQKQQRETEQKRKAHAIDTMLNDLYSIGMTKKEYSSLMIYYLNDEKIYSWVSGISTEKMYNELLEVYQTYYKEPAAI